MRSYWHFAGAEVVDFVNDRFVAAARKFIALVLFFNAEYKHLATSENQQQEVHHQFVDLFAKILVG